jgi:L-ascorbate metabolism protein UlaG (beta-lactamase superfamily)
MEERQMEPSNQNRLLGSADSDGPKAVLPGGYHSRGVPGEEGAMRNRMRVLKVDDRSQRIYNSQPLKGATDAEHTSAAHLDRAAREANWAADARRDEERSGATRDNESAVAYVIAKRGVSALDTPVFHAGDSGEEEVVVLFTGRQAAQEYIDQAGWGESDKIGELGLSELYQWLLEANAKGIHYATVNPERQRHLAGDPQPVLFLDALRDESAENLLQAVTTIALQQFQSQEQAAQSQTQE